MRPIQLFGLFLYRGGLMLAGSYTTYRVARLALRHLELPTQLEIGFGLVAAGCLLFAISLVVERFQDARQEELSEP